MLLVALFLGLPPVPDLAAAIDSGATNTRSSAAAGWWLSLVLLQALLCARTTRDDGGGGTAGTDGVKAGRLRTSIVGKGVMRDSPLLLAKARLMMALLVPPRMSGYGERPAVRASVLVGLCTASRG